MPAAPHILFAGGESAGHLIPGLAVAEHVLRLIPAAQITFAGSGAARERHAVRNAGHHYTMIPAQAAPHNPLEAIRFIADNVAGYCAARWMLREQRISLVVGLGGVTSVAAVRAGVARGIPIVLLEQDAIPSRATRWMSRAAAMVCTGFEEARPYLAAHAPVTVTGNPVRTSFEALHQQAADRGAASPRPATADELALARPARQQRLVVLGGAAGARSLNGAVPAALKKVAEHLAGWQIVHQTGEGQLAETDARYAQLGLQILTVNHIDEIASVLGASDLVVSRACGTTLAELAMAGVPAVVVPYPQAADDHQSANAQSFAQAGACRVVNEGRAADGLDAAIARELEPLLRDRQLRSEMARNMQKLARPKAAAHIAAGICDQLCGISRLVAA